MENKKDEKEVAADSREMVIGFARTVLVLAFLGIYTFLLFGVFVIQDLKGFVPILVFAAIDYFVVFAIWMTNSRLKRILGIPFYAAIITLTAIYLGVQYLYFVLAYQTVHVTTYIAIKLIALFIYLIITYIILLQGTKTQENK